MHTDPAPPPKGNSNVVSVLNQAPRHEEVGRSEVTNRDAQNPGD